MFTSSNQVQNLAIQVPKTICHSHKLSPEAREWTPSQQVPRNFPGDLNLALLSQIKRTEARINEESERISDFNDCLNNPSLGIDPQSIKNYKARSLRLWSELDNFLQQLHYLKSENKISDATTIIPFLEEQNNDDGKAQQATTIIPFSNKEFDAQADAKLARKLAKKARLTKEKEDRAQQRTLEDLPKKTESFKATILDTTVNLKEKEDENSKQKIAGFLASITTCTAKKTSQKYQKEKQYLTEKELQIRQRQKEQALLQQSCQTKKFSQKSSSDNKSDHDFEKILAEQAAYNASLLATQNPDNTIDELKSFFDEIANENLTWSGPRSHIYVTACTHFHRKYNLSQGQLRKLFQDNLELQQKYNAAVKLTCQMAEIHRLHSMHNPQIIACGLLGEKSWHDHLEDKLKNFMRRKK